MSSSVNITFDCLPLRTVGRLDVPLDAPPKFKALSERIARALEAHGSFNTYYLYNAECVFHLTNNPEVGMLQYEFEGTVHTDQSDQKTVRCDLSVKLLKETCDWLTEPIVAWFKDTVPQAVRVEFDRYIAAGDLAAAVKRGRELQARIEEQGGYLGMYL